jgi:hypothetical protein
MRLEPRASMVAPPNPRCPYRPATGRSPCQCFRSHHLPPAFVPVFGGWEGSSDVSNGSVRSARVICKWRCWRSMSPSSVFASRKRQIPMPNTNAYHLHSEQTSSICMQLAQRNEFARAPSASSMLSSLIVLASQEKGRIKQGVKVIAKELNTGSIRPQGIWNSICARPRNHVASLIRSLPPGSCMPTKIGPQIVHYHPNIG